MRSHICFALALTSCVLLLACNSSMKQSSPSMSGGVAMTLTIGDTPPSGVAVLFFEASITAASLQPSGSMTAAASMLTNPVEVEFGHLQTDTAFVSLGNVAPGTYQSLSVTFDNAMMTIVNHSGMSIGSCADNSVCQLTPSFNPSMVSLSSAPFPITISQNSVVGIRLDFNVDSSVQSMQNGLSISPTVTIKKLTQRQDSEDTQEMEQLDEVDGQVTMVGSNSFTLMNERSGQTFNINVDNTTTFQDFDRAGCTASPENFSCVQAGQIVDVDLSENGMGSMLAKRVEFEENPQHVALKGTITSVDSATQFHMVVFNEEPTLSGVTEGSPVVVMIQNATFQVGQEEMGEDGGFSMAGLSFASGSDLLVGQDVQIRAESVSSSQGTTTITTDLVRLWPSQITGTVGNISSDNGMFTLTPVSPLFTGAMPPITAINVVTLSGMDFIDFSGLTSLSSGSTVSVRGLLFKTSGAPTLVTRTMREDQGPGGD